MNALMYLPMTLTLLGVSGIVTGLLVKQPNYRPSLVIAGSTVLAAGAMWAGVLLA